MRGIELIRSLPGDVHLFDLRFLRALSIRAEREGDRPSLSVTVVLETEDRAPNYRVKMTFFDVRSLQISLPGGEGRIDGFDVLEISDRQWEGIRWSVVDHEEDLLHFFCRDAQVDEVGVAEMLPCSGG
jgi:hypothetical protein